MLNFLMTMAALVGGLTPIFTVTIIVLMILSMFNVVSMTAAFVVAAIYLVPVCVCLILCKLNILYWTIKDKDREVEAPDTLLGRIGWNLAMKEAEKETKK